MNYPLYNKELCPDIWTKTGAGYKIIPEVSDALKKIANDFVQEFYEDEGIQIIVKDVWLVGSATNYNWTQYSDLDIHIVSDFSNFDMSLDDAVTFMTSVKANWNKSHNITIKSHEVELYIQPTARTVDSVAIYSIKNDKWIKKPVFDRPTFNKKIIKEKYAELRKQADDLLSNGNEDSLRKLLEKIYTMRQAGLDKSGEFSEENIVFKILRTQGYLDKIKQYAIDLYDKKMTINEIASAMPIHNEDYVSNTDTHYVEK